VTPQEPTAPVPAGPPPAGPPPGGGGGGLTISWKTLAIVLLVVVVGLGAVVAVVALSGDDEAAAEELELEPTSSTGANPFMPPAGTDQSDVTPPPGSGGSFAGDTEGLYGGSLNVSSCDPQKMIVFLQENPGKGAAWAGVLGISVAEIPTYVSELTPIVLRSDTYVTNHGFANGRATVIPAVLQAGTAVLVDKYGTPRVKCYCGNPLTPPKTYSKPRYTGPRWSGFEPSGITIIQQTTVIIDIFVLVDPVTGDTIRRPAGTTGGSDQPGTPTTPSTLPPTQPPQTQPPETQPPGPSAEDQAIAKVQEASAACYPFPAPIEDSNEPPNIFTEPGDSTSFVLVANGTTVSGNFQEFVWRVDRATLAFTPQNSFAQVASDHCPLLR